MKKRRAKASKSTLKQTTKPETTTQNSCSENDSLREQSLKKVAALRALLKKQLRTLSTQYTLMLKKLPPGLDRITVGELLDRYEGNLEIYAKAHQTLSDSTNSLHTGNSGPKTRRTTRAQSNIQACLPETPLLVKTSMNPMTDAGRSLYKEYGQSHLKTEERRITLRGSDNSTSGCSIVLPLQDGSILDLDPEMDGKRIKDEIGHQAREQVVKQVQALQSQLSRLLAGMDVDE